MHDRDVLTGLDLLDRRAAEREPTPEELAAQAVGVVVATLVGLVVGATLGGIGFAAPALWTSDYTSAYASYSCEGDVFVPPLEDIAKFGALLGGVFGTVVGWLVGCLRLPPERTKFFVAIGAVAAVVAIHNSNRCG